MVKIWYWDRYSLYLYSTSPPNNLSSVKEGEEPRLRIVNLCMKWPGTENIVCESRLHRNSFILLFWIKLLFTWSLNVNAWLIGSLPKSVFSCLYTWHDPMKRRYTGDVLYFIHRFVYCWGCFYSAVLDKIKNSLLRLYS